MSDTPILVLPSSPSSTPFREAKEAARQPPEKRPSWPGWLSWIPWIAVLAFLAWLLTVVGRAALIPVLLALSVAYLLQPFQRALESRNWGRATAATTLIFSFFAVLTALLAWCVPSIGNALALTLKKLEGLDLSAQAVHQFLQQHVPTLEHWFGREIDRLWNQRMNWVGRLPQFLAGSLSGVIEGAVGLLDLAIVPFLSFYFLVDMPNFRERFDALLPERFRKSGAMLVDQIGAISQTYVRGQMAIATVMGVLYSLGFLVLRVPAGIAIGFISGFLNLVPYLGTGLGLALAVGMTLIDGGGLGRSAGVLGVFVVVQLLEGYYLTPKWLGGSLDLHPGVVLLGLLVGGKLFGLLGVLLALPTMAVLRVMLQFLLELYKQSDFYLGLHRQLAAQKAEPIAQVIQRAAENTVSAESEPAATKS